MLTQVEEKDKLYTYISGIPRNTYQENTYYKRYLSSNTPYSSCPDYRLIRLNPHPQDMEEFFLVLELTCIKLEKLNSYPESLHCDENVREAYDHYKKWYDKLMPYKDKIDDYTILCLPDEYNVTFFAAHINEYLFNHSSIATGSNINAHSVFTYYYPYKLYYKSIQNLDLYKLVSNDLNLISMQYKVNRIDENPDHNVNIFDLVDYNYLTERIYG